MFIAVFFTITKIWKQSKCPSVDEWIKQLRDIYTMEYYSAIKRRHFTLCDSMMDLKNIMLSEISQSKTNTIWFHLYVESNEPSERTIKIETDS